MKTIKERYAEGQRYIIPTSDWGFKRLFGTELNKKLLIGLLNRIIDDREIESVTYLDDEPLLPMKQVRDLRFDIYCQCKDGSRVIVEMQNYARPSFLDRAQVYTSASILEGYNYSRTKNYKIQKTYFIAILGENVFPKVDRAPVRLAMCDVDAQEVRVMNDKLLQIFIELPKFADSLKELGADASFIGKFALTMKSMETFTECPEELDDDLLKELFAAADTRGYKSKDTEDYKQAIMNEFEYEETLKDYRREGRQEGFEEGRQKGLEEGLAKGRRVGEEEKALSIAKALQAKGISLEVIKSATGVDLASE